MSNPCSAAAAACLPAHHPLPKLPLAAALQGVPTVWLGLIEHMQAPQQPLRLSSLKILVVGGSACPRWVGGWVGGLMSS
jgi:hypothetical protein